MPGRFTSARFVGREAAFGRLAAVLDGAAAGHATTLLVSGGGGVGVSRFLDEAEVRLAALPEPLLVLRGRARPGEVISSGRPPEGGRQHEPRRSEDPDRGA